MRETCYVMVTVMLLSLIVLAIVSIGYRSKKAIDRLTGAVTSYRGAIDGIANQQQRRY